VNKLKNSLHDFTDIHLAKSFAEGITLFKRTMLMAGCCGITLPDQ
jgi:hypothetical protein